MRKLHRSASSANRHGKPAIIEGLEDRRLLSGSLGHVGSIIGNILGDLGIPTGGDFHFHNNQYVVGTVTSVDTTADTISISNPVNGSSAPTTYTLASNATITADGATTTLGSLLAGAHVALQLSTANGATTVTSITAISQNVSGTVSSVDTTANTITLTGFDGGSTTYPVGSSATISLDGSTSTLGALTAGTSAQLTLSALDGKTVTKIQAHTPDQSGGHHHNLPQRVNATVVSVDTTADTLTVSQTQGGSTMQTTYTVDPSATITANGAATPLASLLAGAQVQLTLSATSSTTVTAIAASSPHVSGTVSAVDTTANTISITVHGTATAYTLDSGATITINGASATLAAIATGSQATLTLSAFDGKTVTSISDHNFQLLLHHLVPINATVVSVDTTADTITVSTNAHGATTQTTYTVDPSATITANGAATPLGSFLAGAHVLLRLSATSATTVTSISAISQQVVGTVSSVDTTANTITITELGGTSKTFTVGSSATIDLNGATSTLAALVAGTRVHLQLSALDGATVTSIQGTTPPVIVRHHRALGTVTSVDTTANTITISTPFSGSTTTTTYTLAAGASITANGAPATLSQLSAGAIVFLQLTTTGTTTTVTAITALAQHAQGVASSVDTTADTITITPHHNSATKTYTLGTAATVTLNGKASTLASVTAGARVQLQLSALDGTTVLSVRAHS
jgi:hypothetical protein